MVPGGDRRETTAAEGEVPEQRAADGDPGSQGKAGTCWVVAELAGLQRWSGSDCADPQPPRPRLFFEPFPGGRLGSANRATDPPSFLGFSTEVIETPPDKPELQRYIK